jgi:hypothetical protein
MNDFECNRMLKYNIMNSSHTNSIYIYTNRKRKLLHCNANINFNKTCLRIKLIPKYAQIKCCINNEVARKTLNNEAAKKTLSQAHTLWIKTKIKFLHKKK